MERLILKNINELVTCSGSAPRCGQDMNNAGIIKNGCVIIDDGIITYAGPMKSFDEDCRVIDCSENAVLPGFVDSHTHFVFGGYRQDEYAMRLEGASYMDIMKSGGGIINTVKNTRKASLESLVEYGLDRLSSMLDFGVTTVEGKSGYGLDCETEIKQLKVMKELDACHPVDVTPTFLGAHSVPEGYTADQYLDFLSTDVLPVIKEENLADFVDIFCEKGVFGIGQSESYLKKAKAMGFRLKLHADEIVSLGGAELSARVGAVSADHLLHASETGIRTMADNGVIATLLPATAFSLGEPFAHARKMIDAGCAVALATDFNPGSSFTNSIPLVIALAALKMKMNIREIINALTINGACAIGQQDRKGSIETGKLADILVLRYPSIDFMAYNIGMNTVKTVIKAGEIVRQI